MEGVLQTKSQDKQSLPPLHILDATSLLVLYPKHMKFSLEKSPLIGCVFSKILTIPYIYFI